MRSGLGGVVVIAGVLLLVACGGQAPQDTAGSCDQAVGDAVTAVHEATQAAASTSLPPGSLSDTGEGGQLPVTLRRAVEGSDSGRQAIARMDTAVNDAAELCASEADAYRRIAQRIQRRASDSTTPSPQQLDQQRYMQLTLLALTAEEFQIAATASRPAPSALPSVLPAQFPVHESMRLETTQTAGDRNIITWKAPARTFEQLRLFYEDRLQQGGPGGWHVSGSTGEITIDPQGIRFGTNEKTFAGFGHRGTITIRSSSGVEPVTVRVSVQTE